MKKVLLSILFVVLLTSVCFTQSSINEEVQTLSQQLLVNYKNGELGKAATIAERIVEIQRKQNNLENLATATKNLAIVLKYYNKELRDEIYEAKTTEERKSEIRVIKKDFTERIPKLFDEAIEIYEKKLKSKNLQLAETQFEYALYLTRFQEKFPDMIYEPEKVEKLFSEALSIREISLGKDNDLTLLTLITIANFNHKSANFEKSASEYQNYVQRVEKKYGEKSEFLVPAMRELAQILIAVGKEKEGLGLFKRLTDITGKSETLLIYGLDLTLLNKEDEVKKLMEDVSTVTKYLKKQKWIKVNVRVNEKGKVTEAFVEAPSEKDIFGKDIREKASEDVRKWKLKPFIFEGKPKYVSGFVWYPYFIKA